MKKFLSTAMVLGALYGATANAAPITSPIYMPEAGKILTDLSIGYTDSKFDKSSEFESDKAYKGINISAEGKIGLMDRLSLNYGLNFDFSRDVLDSEQSAKFTDFYAGVTGRVLDRGIHKFDVILNIGQEEAKFFPGADQPYVDLAIRYGLDLDSYNLGFKINGKYINDFELDNDATKLERGFTFGFALENEFIFTERFTMGLDLFYNMHDDIKLSDNGLSTTKIKSFDEYGFNVDANYALNQNNYLGVYFGMAFNDVEYDTLKDETEYNFGLKFTSQF